MNKKLENTIDPARCLGGEFSMNLFYIDEEENVVHSKCSHVVISVKKYDGEIGYALQYFDEKGISYSDFSIVMPHVSEKKGKYA
ncbi:hypothetical protein FACS1894137_14060 [Spirochaetia bacterium]|nr:hypothetical protein FACS1894137_14060 [Spirochaetia bacterium]